MRDAVGGVGDARGYRTEYHAAPVQTDQNGDVEIHAGRQRDVVDQRACDVQWIKPEAAHGIANAQRQRFDPYPDMRCVAAVETRFRYAVVVDRATENHGIRFRSRRGNEARDIGCVVLAVGVDLNGVRETCLPCRAQTGHDRGTLSAVHGQAH